MTTTAPVEAPLYGPDADPENANQPPATPPFLLTLTDRSTDEVKDHWPALQLPKLKKDRDGLKWAWRSANPDFTSTNGYRWPFPGHWAEAPGPFQTHDGACPNAVGDGICLAWTIRGAMSSGMRLGTGLICGYHQSDILGCNDSGDHATKFRVKRAWVAEVVNTITELTQGSADLRYADLRSANLGYANLGSANLGSANLRYANLRSADLRYANLRYANLRYANLGSATYSQLTLWPAGFDPVKAGAVLLP